MQYSSPPKKKVAGFIFSTGGSLLTPMIDGDKCYRKKKIARGVWQPGFESQLLSSQLCDFEQVSDFIFLSHKVKRG